MNPLREFGEPVSVSLSAEPRSVCAEALAGDDEVRTSEGIGGATRATLTAVLGELLPLDDELMSCALLFGAERCF